MKAAKQLCDDLHWSVAQNRSIVQLYSWKSQHFTTHCQERNAACFSPPKFLQQLCYDFEDIAQLRVPRTYLFTCHCTIHDTESEGHTSFGKPGLACLSLATNYQTQVSERSAKKLKSNASEGQKQIVEGQAGNRGVPKRS